MEFSIKKPSYNKMTSIIYNYPKSSCICEDYIDECTDFQYGIPTNSSIQNCDTPSCLELSNSYVFKNKIEPTNEYGLIAINPQNEMKDIDTSFIEYTCPENICSKNTAWYSTDPRLKSVTRGGSILPLDKPPKIYNIDINTIDKDEQLKKYGQNYKSYADINAGQISYFIDKSKQDAFYYPDFNTSARTIGYLYKDPMGGIKPHYERQPLTYTNPLETKRVRSRLSFIEDTEAHRQDLLARQMYRVNQERWDPRWT